MDMTQTITRSYEGYETARRVVGELEAAGVASADISLIGRHRASNAGEGAGLVPALGGTAGLLAGLSLVIPGSARSWLRAGSPRRLPMPWQAAWSVH
jgi:hypothetical protein